MAEGTGGGALGAAQPAAAKAKIKQEKRRSMPPSAPEGAMSQVLYTPLPFAAQALLRISPRQTLRVAGRMLAQK